jgi:hypothetical protein
LDPVTNINREMSGKPALDEGDPRRKRASRIRPPAKQAARNRQPQASESASILAQAWYDEGAERGFSFPYDVNYLALAIQRKVENDPEMQPFLNKGKHEQVERWVAKMIERWWAEYADNTIHAGNAKDYFLRHDWEDLRYYARSCLRAKYLLEHGRLVPPPLYPNQQEYQDRLQEIRQRESINANLRKVEEDDLPERHPVDEQARERLRSFAEKRRKK